MRTRSLQSLVIVGMFSLTLLGCGGGSSSGRDSFENPTMLDDKIVEDLDVSVVGVTPVTKSSLKNSFPINIINNTPYHWVQKSLKVTDGDSKPSRAISVQGDLCDSLAANSSCSLEYTPKLIANGFVIVTLEMQNTETGRLQTLSVPIRLTTKVNTVNGIIMPGDVDSVLTRDGNYAVVIPFILDKKFTNVFGKNGVVTCNDSNYSKGSGCAISVSGTIDSPEKIIELEVNANQNNHPVAKISQNIRVIEGLQPLLLLTHAVEVLGDDKDEAEVVIYNRGTDDIASFNISSRDSKITILNQEKCKSLGVKHACVFKIKANSAEHGVSSLTVDYQDKTALSTVHYIGQNNLGLDIVISNSLENVIAGSSKSITATLINRGNTQIEQLKIATNGISAAQLKTEGKANGNVPACASGEGAFILNAASQCSFSIRYTPVDADVGGSFNLLVTGLYKIDGKLLPYGSSQEISYSSVTPNDLLTAEGRTLNFSIPSVLRQNITIKNTGARLIKLKDLAHTRSDLINLEWGDKNTKQHGESPCTSSTKLRNGDQCYLTMEYLSKAAHDPELARFGLSYDVIADDDHAVEGKAYLPLTITATHDAPHIVISEASYSAHISDTNDGSSDEKAVRFGYSGTPLQVSYTIGNKGGLARNFYILPQLPVGASVDFSRSDACSVAGDRRFLVNLNHGDVCTVTFNIPNKASKILQRPIYNSSHEISGNVNITAHYLAVNSRTELVTTARQAHVRWSRNWRSVLTPQIKDSKVETTVVNGKISYNLKLIASGDVNTIFSAKLGAGTHFPHYNSQSSITTCTILTSTNSCEILINEIAFLPKAPDSYLLELSASFPDEPEYILTVDQINVPEPKLEWSSLDGGEIEQLNIPLSELLSGKFNGADSIKLKLVYSGEIAPGAQLIYTIHTGDYFKRGASERFANLLRARVANSRATLAEKDLSTYIPHLQNIQDQTISHLLNFQQTYYDFYLTAINKQLAPDEQWYRDMAENVKEISVVHLFNVLDSITDGLILAINNPDYSAVANDNRRATKLLSTFVSQLGAEAQINPELVRAVSQLQSLLVELEGVRVMVEGDKNRPMSLIDSYNRRQIIVLLWQKFAYITDLLEQRNGCIFTAESKSCIISLSNGNDDSSIYYSYALELNLLSTELLSSGKSFPGELTTLLTSTSFATPPLVNSELELSASAADGTSIAIPIHIVD